jgi:AcrR family transcriptional regulator
MIRLRASASELPWHTTHHLGDYMDDPSSLTMSQLERVSGVPRTTIHFYLRERLLGPGLKTSATRALYSQRHLDRLSAVERLKKEGLSLPDIKRQLGEDWDLLDQPADNHVRRADLERQSILEAAARRFANVGYAGTRVADIVKDVGVNKQVLYSHFPTKRELFLESLEVYVGWLVVANESAIRSVADPYERLLMRMAAFVSLQKNSPLFLSLLRAESWTQGEEAQTVAERILNKLVQPTIEELEALRSEKTPAGLREDTFAHGLLGFGDAVRVVSMISRQVSITEALRASVAIFASVRAIWSGELAVGQLLDKYDGLISQIARAPGNPLQGVGSGQVAAAQFETPPLPDHI